MTGPDYNYIVKLVEAKIINGPVLELGAGYGGKTCKDIFTKRDIPYYRTDIIPGIDVDFVADFTEELSLDEIKSIGPFSTVLVLNVLEHVFDPIKILNNALSVLNIGGLLVVITPCIWTLHSYPHDIWRIMPQFYERYADYRDLDLLEDYFVYLGRGKVQSFRDIEGNYQFPQPVNSYLRYLYGRFIHKIFNSFGRGMAFPSHLTVGAVFLKKVTKL